MCMFWGSAWHGSLPGVAEEACAVTTFKAFFKDTLGPSSKAKCPLNTEVVGGEQRAALKPKTQPALIPLVAKSFRPCDDRSSSTEPGSCHGTIATAALFTDLDRTGQLLTSCTR